MTAESPFLCMTADEYELWEQEVPGSKTAKYPCADCPMAWRLERQAEGLCNRRTKGRQPRTRIARRRPRKPNVATTVDLRRRYANDHERQAARRQQWREYKRRIRGSSWITDYRTEEATPTMLLSVDA